MRTELTRAVTLPSAAFGYIDRLAAEKDVSPDQLLRIMVCNYEFVEMQLAKGLALAFIDSSGHVVKEQMFYPQGTPHD